MKNVLIILKQLTKNLNQETNTTEGFDRVVELEIDTCFLNLGGFFWPGNPVLSDFMFFCSPKVIKIKSFLQQPCFTVHDHHHIKVSKI